MSKAKKMSFELVVAADKEVALHNLFHRRGMISALQGVGWLVMAGLQLAAEKKKLKHGQWESWVEHNCDYDIRTAQKYMGLGDGVKGRALKNESRSFFKLLESSPADLSPDQQEKLFGAVQKLTDGETVADLYRGFGIVKSLAGSGLKGKKRKHTPGTDVNDAAKVASDLWKPHIEFLEDDGLERRSWKDLPTAELDRLRAVHTDLGRLIRIPKSKI